MKSFLTTTKGKIIAGIGTAAVVAVVVVAIIMANSGYRTIAVEELNGTTSVTNNGSTSDAYVGQHLKSGDDVSVKSQSNLTLGLDSDKFVYAKENTHFWVEAAGKADNTRTTIKLDEGSSICRIDNKLKESESFEVDTPNSTMSVRGTVFKTESHIDAAGDRYTVVDVFEGAVYVQVKMETGTNTDESRMVNAGERAIVRSNKDISEFVKSDSNEIIYSELTEDEALFLGKAIDEGRSLSIEKNLLFDIVGLVEHDFSVKGEEVDSTCKEEGYYIEVCAICGAEGERHVIAKKNEHDFAVDKNDSTKKVCKICGLTDNAENDKAEIEEEEPEDEIDEQVAEEEENPCKNGHSFETVTVAATCTGDGYEDDVCMVCGYKTNHVVLNAIKHQYEITEQAATCEVDGLIYHRCKYCSDVWADVIKASGHNYSTSVVDATCTSDGSSTKTCSNCGVSESQTIPAKGHSRGAQEWDGDSHWYTCTTCGAKLGKAAHNLIPGDGCSGCGFH